jgi:hypothetical protein
MTRPLEPWEYDYPHRLPMWQVEWPLRPNNRPSSDEGGDWAPEQVYRRAQISAAYQVERLARAFMRGEQITGILAEPRHRMVDAASTPQICCRIWAAQARTPEVQALVDRAVGCWRQCVERGVTVFEYDRPGYDEVTKSFEPLLRYASDASVTPVVLEWDPTYHGEAALLRCDPETGEPLRAPASPPPAPEEGGRARLVYVIVPVVILVALLGAMAAWA